MVRKISENLPENKPFLLLKGKSEDFIKALGMSNKYLHICPRCGTPITHAATVVYVAVEDAVMCSHCADRWLQNTRWYSEDVPKEKANYEAMIQKLKDSKLWQE